jgi:hypothetical protein
VGKFPFLDRKQVATFQELVKQFHTDVAQHRCEIATVKEKQQIKENVEIACK